ncbi:MAG TPA: transposase [Phycisphaerae bacterium]|nr:transposase [Phycisphaerae bacterium]HSA29976.1 transposase [Phycisphaerae bacterium]
MAEFSGYIAADELYDGPYCVLSIVDNRKFRRLTYRVLDHNPTHEDILRFFKDFKKELDRRGLALQGITTDGSPLYPTPIRTVFGDTPHPICEFHVIKELTQAILRTVAQERKRLKASMPILGRGRPSPKTRKAAQRRKRLERKVTDLFDHRHLFVKHHLTPGEKKTLRRITRGLPQLLRLREIMDKAYRLFDRRCRTDTALDKLARLRRRVQRSKSVSRTLAKLFSENLDKALTFLDDSLLPSTSNAVERGNRRHRKMQKTVYRVRTQAQISRRIAADMQREAQMIGRIQTTRTLHENRNRCQVARY